MQWSSNIQILIIKFWVMVHDMLLMEIHLFLVLLIVTLLFCTNSIIFFYWSSLGKSNNFIYIIEHFCWFQIIFSLRYGANFFLWFQIFLLHIWLSVFSLFNWNNTTFKILHQHQHHKFRSYQVRNKMKNFFLFWNMSAFGSSIQFQSMFQHVAMQSL